MMHAIPLLLLLALTSQEVAAPADWRAFRGVHGVAPASARVPFTWSAEDNLAWKLELPGPGTSSPIVVGDGVYVTCWSGYGLDRENPGDRGELRRHLLRVHRESGEIVWTRTFEPVDSEDEFGGRMAGHGYASNTPVSDGRRIYVFLGKSGVHAFELDGRAVWRADVGTSSSRWTTGSGSSLACRDGLVFVNASDESQSLRALRTDTGREVWKRRTGALDQAYGTPVIAGRGEDAVLLFALLGEIWALDPRTGAKVWSVKTKTGGALAQSVIVRGDMAYSYGGRMRERSYAVRLGGRGDVTDSHVEWRARWGPYVATPALVAGRFYWSDSTGIVHCADAKTGDIVFRDRLAGGCYASPIVVGDHVILVTRQDGTYVLRAGEKFEVVAHNVIEGDDSLFDGTPAVSADRLFLRSRKALYCIKE